MGNSFRRYKLGNKARQAAKVDPNLLGYRRTVGNIMVQALNEEVPPEWSILVDRIRRAGVPDTINVDGIAERYYNLREEALNTNIPDNDSITSFGIKRKRSRRKRRKRSKKIIKRNKKRKSKKRRRSKKKK